MFDERIFTGTLLILSHLYSIPDPSGLKSDLMFINLTENQSFFLICTNLDVPKTNQHKKKDSLAFCVYLNPNCVFSAEAAGKMVREEGKLDLGSASDDNFHDGLVVPPPAAELLSNAHSSRSDGGETRFVTARQRQTDELLCRCRSTSACVSPLADAEAGNLFYDFNNLTPRSSSNQIKTLGSMASPLM